MRKYLFLIGFILSSNLLAQTQPTDTTTYIALVDSSFLAGNQGDYQKAADYLRRAITLLPQHPLNVQLLNNIGGIQQLINQPEAALLSYTAALNKDPNEATIRYNRARLYALMKNTKAAITDYSLLVAQHPTNELYRYQRAMTYMLSGELDLAELDLREIIEKNPTTLKGRIGYALLMTAKRQFEEAEHVYDYLSERLPKNVEVYEGKARMYLARNMMGFAMRDINKAFELSGGHPSSTLFRLRAEINQAMGYTDAATRDNATALKMENQTAFGQTSNQ